MTFPPIKKTFEGLLQNFSWRLTLVERRLAVGGSGGGSTVIDEGPGIDVSGTGALADPYIISADGSATLVTNWNTTTAPGNYRAAAGAVGAPQPTYEMTGVNLQTAAGVQQRLSVPFGDMRGRNEWVRSWTGVAWGVWARTDRLMIPSSVNGGTFDPVTGRFMVTGNVWSMNGVFGQEFRAYRILFQYYLGGLSGGGFRFRANGVDHNAANYVYGGWHNSGSTLGGLSGTTDAGAFPGTQSAGGHGELVVTEPAYTAATANQKRVKTVWAGYSPNNLTHMQSALNGADTMNFDGFTIYVGIAVAPSAHAWISCEGIA